MNKKLNIGAGEYPLSGFINMDVYEFPGVELICNAIKLPMEDNSLDEIFMGHSLEHNTMSEARKILKECLRVLKPLGKIGIVVPEKDLTPKHMIKGSDFPEQPYRAHHSYWTLKMLREEVKKAGFEDIEDIDISTYPYLVARPSWQVGVKAIKGGLNMKKEKNKVEKKIEIPKFDEKENSWCKHEEKVIYNPTKKVHCPKCGRLL